MTKLMSCMIAVGITGAAVLAGVARAEDGPVAKACAEDKAKFCADVPHGGGQVRACLDANQEKVSETCRAALGSHGPAAKKDGQSK